MKHVYYLIVAGIAMSLIGCGPAMNSNVAVSSNVNTRSNVSNTANTNTAVSSSVDAKEPDRYQAKIDLSFEALGETQNAALPVITAVVSRSGADRRMEFTLPNGEKVVYLDTANNNYLILPNRRQYAELSREALGFDVRRMMMPEQIVNQVKTIQGVQPAGEETVNGRKAMKYRYSSTTNTQTQAGQVGTESFILVDSETGLPLRSETVSQSTTGGNVQGYKGVKVVTVMSDIQLQPDQSQFTLPTDYAKIDAEQVKAQANLIFSAVATLVGQAMQHQSPQPVVSPTRTP
jgi:hypothetical protein